MSLPRLRLERCRFLGKGLWRVDEKQAHHLCRVLRVRQGEEIEGLLAGERYRIRLEVVEGGIDARVLEILPEKETLPGVVLMASLLKGGDFERLLRGATETGVSAIIPIEAGRSVVRVPPAERAKKMARWERILEEATRQCGAADVPSISEPLPLERAVELPLPKLRLAGMLCEGAVPLGRIKVTSEAVVAIGPEGDWDESETEVLRLSGFQPVSLGPLVLKAFTAAIVACSYLVLSWEGRENGKPEGETFPDPCSRMPDKPV